MPCNILYEEVKFPKREKSTKIQRMASTSKEYQCNEEKEWQQPLPILDALTRLEHEGLVTNRNRVGTFATPLGITVYTGL